MLLQVLCGFHSCLLVLLEVAGKVFECGNLEWNWVRFQVLEDAVHSGCGHFLGEECVGDCVLVLTVELVEPLFDGAWFSRLLFDGVFDAAHLVVYLSGGLAP